VVGGGLEELVRALAGDGTVGSGWAVEQMPGGFNSLVYRCRGDAIAGPVAVKFSRRDGRHRTRREAAAQRILADRAPGLAPCVLHVSEDGPQTAIVSTWLEGPAHGELPVDDDEWACLVDHLAAVHEVDARRGGLLAPALDGNGSDAFAATLRAESARSPDSADLALVDRAPCGLERAHLDPVAPRLVRSDPSLRNFIRRPHGWASVDWENSGAGDPCFEIAELLCHPEYLDVGERRQTWIAEQYAARSPIPDAAIRILTYRPALLAWWVLRMQRLVREIADGTDQRLTPWPDGFLEIKTAELNRYRRLAHAAVS